MSNIWNPHAFGVTGQPVGPQVNTLRVYGAEPSKEQLAMAQQTFAKFCMTDRLSFAPNQTQQGFLPDGSKYRIVVVGNTRIMEVRVDGDEEKFTLRGVGVRALFSGTPFLFVLTFRRGRWWVRAVDEFYGGSGVWVGRSGRYLTDDTVKPGSTLVSPRRFTPMSDQVVVRRSDTSVLLGLAYSSTAGGGVGIFASRKFVYLLPSYSSNPVFDVQEAPLLAESSFAITPGTPAAETGGTVHSVMPAMPPLGEMARLEGRAKFSRARDGSAIFFPVTTASAESSILAQVMDLGEWMPSLPLTHEVHFRTADYAVNVVERSPRGVLTVAPPSWTIEPGVWAAKIDHSFHETHAAQHGPLDFGFGFVGTGVAVRNRNYTRAWTAQYSQRRSGERPVYLARDWDDNLVQFSLKFEEERKVTHSLTMQGARQAREAFNPGPHDEVVPSDPTTPDDWSYMHATGGTPENEGATEHVEATEKVAYRHTQKSRLKTPWGDLMLDDVDVSLSVTYEGSEDLENTSPKAAAGLWHTYELNFGIMFWVTSDLSHGGKVTPRIASFEQPDRPAISRKVRFIDPVLGLIAYTEVSVNSYEVTLPGGPTLSGVLNTAYIFSTGEIASKFVLLHRGVQLISIDLPAPSKGFAAYTDMFRGFGLIRPGDTEVVVSSGYPNSGRYIFSSPDGHQAIPFTWTIQLTDSKTDDYARSFSARVVSKPGIPRIPLPGGMPPDNIKIHAAIDPNSGGGVVTVHDGGAFRGGWAISDTGAVTALAGLLKHEGSAPDDIDDLVVSV